MCYCTPEVRMLFCPKCTYKMTIERLSAINFELKGQNGGLRLKLSDALAEIERLREAIRKAHGDLARIPDFRDQCNVFASSARRVLKKALARSGGEG